MTAVMGVLDAEIVHAQDQLDKAFGALRVAEFSELTVAVRNVHVAEGRLLGLVALRTRFSPLAAGVTAVPGPCVGTHRISVVEPFLVVCTGCAWTYLVASEPGVRPTVADAEVAWNQAHR
jgi:hypothetical protein